MLGGPHIVPEVISLCCPCAARVGDWQGHPRVRRVAVNRLTQASARTNGRDIRTPHGLLTESLADALKGHRKASHTLGPGGHRALPGSPNEGAQTASKPFSVLDRHAPSASLSSAYSRLGEDMQARVPLGVPGRLRSAFRVRRGWRSSAAWVSQCAGRCASRSRQGGGPAKLTEGVRGTPGAPPRYVALQIIIPNNPTSKPGALGAPARPVRETQAEPH